MSDAEAINAAVRTPGTAVGRYVLFDEIASGGMASVHLGRLLGPAGFARTVAIKRLHPEHARDPEFVAMFLDEARLAARIRHPNVVPIIDVVALSQQLFLVMEYIPGESLSRLVRAADDRQARLPLPIALTIVTDILYGLHAAHEAQDERGEPLSIVHRDVSPHNVLVGKDGVARVLDFGVAKAASRASTTRDGKVKGKFAYMAPEQLKRGPVDRRADVFAASIVLWEVLCGERLFAADDLAGIVARVLNDPLEPPAAHAGLALPAGLDAIVMKGLERDPERRFQTAMEMAKAIESLRGLARPGEVGAWVDAISGDVLKKRAEQVQDIETDSRGSVPLQENAPIISQAARVGERTMQLEEPEALTENMTALGNAVPASVSSVSAVPARRSRRVVIIAAAAALLIAVVSIAAFGSSSEKVVAPPAVEQPVVEEPVIEEPVIEEPAHADLPKEAPAPRVQRTARRRTPSAKPIASPKADCSPNFYFDADGIKHFKPECL